MKFDHSRIVAMLAVAVFAWLAGTQAPNAQPTPVIKRNILLKQDMEIPGREAIMALVELPPGSAEGKHTHPAELYVFVQEGLISLEVDGKPTVMLKAGDIFHVATGSIHQAINSGNTTAKLAAVFVAEKGKPLTMSTD